VAWGTTEGEASLAVTLFDGSDFVMEYNRPMFRCARIGFVAALAIAVGSVPLVLDQCAATCEMHHESVASTPACHHSGATGAHLRRTPQPCGHDHNGTSVTPDGGSIPTIRNLAMGTAIVPMPISPALVASSQTLHAHAPPGPSPQFDRRSLTLRI
jgi:hypothetical protein